MGLHLYMTTPLLVKETVTAPRGRWEEQPDRHNVTLALDCSMNKDTASPPALPRPLTMVSGEVVSEGETMMPRLRLVRGQWLKQLRLDAGLTQREVATVLGFESLRAVSALEVGGASVGQHHWPVLAELYGVAQEEFGRKMLAVSDPTLYGMIFGERKENVGGPHIQVITTRKVTPKRRGTN